MKKLLKIFSTIIFFYIIVKITDVTKNLIVASILGVSLDADVYLGVLNIPDILLILIGFDSIKGVLNSEFSSLKANDNYNELWQSFAKLFIIFFILGVVFLSVFVVFRNNVVGILLPGFSGFKKDLAVNVFLIITPVFLFKIIFSLSQAVSNAFHKYYMPIIVPALINFTIIGSLMFKPVQDNIVYNLAYGITAGNFIVILILLFFNFRLGATFKGFNLKLDKITAKVLKSISVMAVMVIINQIFFVSRNYFASFMADGSVSVLNYATMVSNIFSVSIFTVFFNVLLSETSTLFANNKKTEAKELFFNITFSLFYFIIPVVITLLVSKNSILQLIFLRGNFSKNNIELLFNPYFWEALALIPYVIFICFVSLYLSVKKYILMSKIGIPIFIFGIFLNYLLSKYLGLYGISLSYFIISTVYGVLLFFFSKGFIGELKIYVIQLVKMILCGIAVYAIVNFTHSYINYDLKDSIPAHVIYLLLIFLLTFGIYYLFTYILNIHYFKRIIELFLKKEIAFRNETQKQD